MPHVVQPGETLWSIAAANNLTTRTVAAFNGLSENSQVVLGLNVMVPSTRRGLRRAAEGRASSRPRRPLPPAAAPAAAPASAPRPRRSAATPCALATRSPASPPAPACRVNAIAAMNGLNPNGVLLAGTVHQAADRRSGTGARRAARARPPRSSRSAAPAADPRRASAPPTSSRSPPPHGVSPSLATAIAWQESGFNNAMVSCANARGVMQVMPGTWDYVQQNLATRKLDPHSASDNVTAGVLYLK